MRFPCEKSGRKLMTVCVSWESSLARLLQTPSEKLPDSFFPTNCLFFSVRDRVAVDLRTELLNDNGRFKTQ